MKGKLTTDETPLSNDDARWLAYYIENFNARQSAIAIGIEKHRASDYGNMMLRKPNIQTALVEWRQKLAEKHGITVDKVIRELAIIGFANMDDYTILLPDGKTRVIDFGKADRTKMAAVESIVVDEQLDEDGEFVRVRRVKLKLHSKLDALIKLLGHLGLESEPLPGQRTGDTHYHVHMNGLEPPRAGEDRSYREGYEKAKTKTIEHRDDTAGAG